LTYIGQQPSTTFDSGIQDRFTGLSSNTVTLTHDISAETDILVVWNNIVQDSGTYSVGGTGNKTLTLGGTLVSADVVTVYYLNKVMQSVNPTAGSVTTATINDTAVTAAKLNSDVKLGKIGQVIQTTKTDTTSISSATFAQISGFSVSITPSATSSKILCMVQLNLGNNSTNLYARLMRDTTSIFQSDSASNRPQATYGYTSHGQYAMNPSPIIYMDSPSSTSALAYSVYWRSDGSTTGYMNRTVGDRDTANFDPRGTSSIVVMEVLA